MDNKLQDEQLSELNKVSMKNLSSRFGKTTIFLSVLAFALLIIGIGVTVYGLQSRQNANSNADTNSYIIYQGQFGADWKAHSNPEINTAETQPLYIGSHSMSFLAESSNDRLDLHSNIGVNSSPYTFLHFATYASVPGQKYSIALLTSGATFVPLANFGVPIQNQWKVYNIPLSVLSADNATVQGFILKSTTEQQPKLFISDIELITQSNQEPTAIPAITNKLTGTPSPTIPPNQPSPTKTPTGGNNLDSFFSPIFSGTTFCQFSHQVEGISGTILTVQYPAGSSAQSAGAPYGGAQICIPYVNGGGTDATLTYNIRFPVGFQFVKGGKLPGLYGGIEPFSGGSHNANGWSMRLMWRAGGAGEVYAYISTTTGYGDDYGRGNFNWLADGQWHQVVEHVHLNTPNKSDGYVTLSYNGVLVVSQTGLPITTTNTKITGLFFSTFYGGHDSTWAPTADQHIDFMGFSGTAQ